MNHTGRHGPGHMPEAEAVVAGFDYESAIADGKYLLLERVLAKPPVGIVLPANVRPPKTVYSTVLSVGPEYKGQARVGDRVVYINCAALGVKGPNGGDLVCAHETNIMVVDKSANTLTNALKNGGGQ